MPKLKTKWLNVSIGSKSTRQIGFTIVELLIVIVVIAILATISVVAYNGIQDRANDAAVESDISNIIKKMEEAKVLLGRYPQSASEFAEGFKFTKSAYSTTRNNAYYCLDMDNDRYSFGLVSKSGRGYFVTMGAVTSDVPVSGDANCRAIDESLVSGSNRHMLQGHMSTASTTYWNSGWDWTN